MNRPIFDGNVSHSMNRSEPDSDSDEDEPSQLSPVWANSLSKSLGPVPNLEEHVRPDWWKKIFNAMYLKTDGDVVDDPNITRKEVDLFARLLNLSPHEKILDLACGQGRHVLELSRRGFTNAEGFDFSSFLIRKAKRDAREECLPAKFQQGDARKLPYPNDTFEVITILGNSFGYFESAQDDFKVLKEVLRILKPSGRLLIDLTNGNYVRKNFDRRSWEWIDKEYFVCRERELSADGQRLISREVITSVNDGVVADQFYAERLYSVEGMTKLLKDVGFRNVKAECEFAPESQRNQDLGMMVNRIAFTATIKKEWTPVKHSTKEHVFHVAVVMGDPNRPDKVKPDSTFDDDDLHTIDEFRNALHDVPGREFTFFNNHNTLLRDLQNNIGKFEYVFNLCDEGYYNNATFELHVPALLEILNIPYTGANPQCLAYCFDKALVRDVAKELGIPVPEASFIDVDDDVDQLDINFPIIVKPNFADNSLGITRKCVCHDLEQLKEALAEIRTTFGYNRQVLLEEFLPGKDLSVGIIGNPGSFKVLPVNEDDYSALPPGLPPICGYEAKWDPNSPYWTGVKSVRAELPEETEKFLAEASKVMFERTECRDYARFDWRLDANGNPKLLEVNPNCGWSWDSHLTKMVKYAGYSYAHVFRFILEAAEKRLGIQ